MKKIFLYTLATLTFVANTNAAEIAISTPSPNTQIKEEPSPIDLAKSFTDTLSEGQINILSDKIYLKYPNGIQKEEDLTKIIEEFKQELKEKQDLQREQEKKREEARKAILVEEALLNAREGTIMENNSVFKVKEIEQEENMNNNMLSKPENELINK